MNTLENPTIYSEKRGFRGAYIIDIFAQNINCGHSLDPHRGSPNAPHLWFFAKQRKIYYYHLKNAISMKYCIILCNEMFMSRAINKMFDIHISAVQPRDQKH